VSIGEVLSEARREAGLTVAELSERTRIRETIIAGIEHDDFSACGGDSYVRGYIRSIARAVGADPDPLIWQYMTARLEPATVVDTREASSWAFRPPRQEPRTAGDNEAEAPPPIKEQGTARSQQGTTRPEQDAGRPEQDAAEGTEAGSYLPIWDERALSREPQGRALTAEPEPSIWDQPAHSTEPAAAGGLAEPESPIWNQRVISPEPAPAKDAVPEPEPPIWAFDPDRPEPDLAAPEPDLAAPEPDLAADEDDAPAPEPSIWDQDAVGHEQRPVRGSAPAPSIWDQDTPGPAPGPVRDVPAPEPSFWDQRQEDQAPRAAVDDAEPVRPTRSRKRLRLTWIGGLVLVWLALAAYDLHSGLPLSAGAAPSAPARPASRQHTGSPTPSPREKTTPGTGRVHALTPASVASFQPYGNRHADHPELARLAIDPRLTTAWRTDWYSTSHLGNLYPGAGLLVDMGHQVTITAARVRLGHPHGAAFQLRVGDAPAIAGLRTVAQVTDAGGVVHVPLARSARGRYVLIWFTTLPPTSRGNFQANVYNIWLGGRS
jgi:transcriptional regulator with XRE-family HTH domain